MCKCIMCGKRPEEIEEYVECAKQEEMTPEQYVKSCEGTYNSAVELFYCTDCYIKAGMPLGIAQPLVRSPLMSSEVAIKTADELTKDLVDEFAEAGLKVSGLRGVDIDGDKL